MALIPLLSFMLVAVQSAEIKVDLEEGAVIERARKIKVTVVSEKPVTQVEFYVGDDLRDSDTSVPFEFAIDPLNETEGETAFKFMAYTEEGLAASKSIRIRLDSGISKGADYHVDEAVKFVSRGAYDDAIAEAKVALKADPKHFRARIVMARAYLGKGELDRAQQLTEDALASKPESTEARDLLTLINLRKAFGGGGGNKADALVTMANALASAVDTRKAVLEEAFKNAGEPTESNRLRYADAAIRAAKYVSAANALATTFQKNPTAAEGNRLAFAQARAGRPTDALQTLKLAELAGVIDTYGYALKAALLAIGGDPEGADASLKEALIANSDDEAVLLSQFIVAMNRGAVTLPSLAANLSNRYGATPEVNYYLLLYYTRMGQSQDAYRSFTDAILAEPAIHDVYLEMAMQSMTPILVGRTRPAGDELNWALKTSEMYVEAAQKIRPDGPDVLTARTFQNFLLGKPNETLVSIRAAVNSGKNYAPAHYTASAVYSAAQVLLRRNIVNLQGGGADGRLNPIERAQIKRWEDDLVAVTRLTDEERVAAGRLDPRLRGRGVPTMADAFIFFYSYGRSALMPPPR